MKKLTKIEKEIKELTGKLNELKRTRVKLQGDRKSQKFKFKFRLEIELWDDDIWPDGDAPLKPAVDDVWAVIWDESDGGGDEPVIDILKEWNLVTDPDEFLTITKMRTPKAALKKA